MKKHFCNVCKLKYTTQKLNEKAIFKISKNFQKIFKKIQIIFKKVFKKSKKFQNLVLVYIKFAIYIYQFTQ